MANNLNKSALLIGRNGLKLMKRYIFSPANDFRLPEKMNTMKNMRAQMAQHVEKSTKKGSNQSSNVDHNSLAYRTMTESYDQVIIPLSSDELLRLKYMNIAGYTRFGLLLEDMDDMAVWLSYKHNQGPSNPMSKPSHHPMTCVTACVDKIDLYRAKGNRTRIPLDRDIVLEGHVSHAGRSSLEIRMRMMQQQPDSNQWLELVRAEFVMVARHPTTNQAVPVHPLKLNKAEEEAIFKQGEDNKKHRERHARDSLFRMPPTEAERSLLHDLFLKTIDETSQTFKHRSLPENHLWMEDCKIKNAVVCFPEQRNLYGKIFGGFLMRRAFELAWSNAALFCHGRPTIVAVDDIMFRKSVEIGSLLFFASEVCFTSGNYIQVRVDAEVVNTQSGNKETTNTFQFTFYNREAVPVVTPNTYADGMLYLDAKRHFEEKRS